MIDDLLGEFQIALSPAAVGVIEEHRLSVARGLGQTNVTWDESLEDLIAEEVPQVVPDLVREVGALVEHGQQDAFY